MKGFEAFREATRHGIERGGGEPVLVNEDLPASGESSRNACLDAVESCDLLALVIGGRGGWRAPSGQLVVEEEFHHARAHRLPVMVFLQDIERDTDAERFVKSISEFTTGTFHKVFKSVDELESQVARAVEEHAQIMNRPANTGAIVTERLGARARNRNEPTLRVVIVPERHEEVITPMDLESEDFAQILYSIGHSGASRLLNYQNPKTHKVTGNTLVIEQDDPNGRWDKNEFVRVTVAESGMVEIDAAVIRRSDRNSFAASVVVVVDDLTRTLQRSLSFVAGLYDHIDPHRRHQRFMYGVALLEMGHRQITRETAAKQSYGMSMRGNEALAAFESARVLTRDDLAKTEKEIDRVVKLLERAARD